MTNEVQTTTSTITTPNSSNNTSKQQKRTPFQSSFPGQMMRSNRKTSSNVSPPLSAPINLTDNKLANQHFQAQPSKSKPTKRDTMLSKNNEENSPVLAAASPQDNDENNVHISREPTSNGSGPDDDSDKHHVGPVMGIFFKVWSLVKVTKVRNHQKMRRQNSEDTTQFQYIPGSQLARSSQQQQQHYSAGGLLEDRHFRRAGSQPAPSSSRSSDQYVASGSRYQQLQPAAGQLVAGATTGTNSSSSGVSSAASSCLANEPSSAVRRHLSAYSLRRSGAASSADRAQLASQQVGLANAGSSKANSGAKPSGWAAKIKRSATTVNQTDVASYASRYRFRRSNQQPIVGAGNGGRLVGSSKSEERTTAGSDEESHRAGAGGKLTTSTNELLNRGDDDEEEDSNDIYSTPNDSIQSVPILGNEMMLPQAISVHQAASQAYPIIKSFSTTNFNQLLKQHTGSAHNSFEQNHHNHHYQQQQQAKFKPIDELQTAENSATRLDQADYELFQRQDSSQSGSMSRRLNGSRIFISSSSSEDSNHSPANQHQHQHQQLVSQQQQEHHHHHHHQTVSLRQTERQQSSAQLLDQERPQVPLQLGVHYHAPAFRPSSLMFGSTADGQVMNLVMPVSLFTPMSNAPAAAHLYQQGAVSPSQPPTYLSSIGYRKSPSMMEIVNGPRLSSSGSMQGFGAKAFPPAKPSSNSTFKPVFDQKDAKTPLQNSAIPNSISLHDCKLSSHEPQQGLAVNQRDFMPMLPTPRESLQQEEPDEMDSEYKLAKMLLEFSSNPKIKDQHGYTALMHAVLSDNLPVLKCLIENGADLNEINQAGFSALDLVCTKAPTAIRLEILKFLIDKQANMDQSSERDGTRLLDRLIAQHRPNDNKLPFIDCLLQNGAKLGSSTWNAADGKYEIQLKLLEKLCQDGYFLYKKSSIAAAIYRFEYALKRIDELEQQLSNDKCRHAADIFLAVSKQSVSVAVRQIKYQTYLGLSRCECKRKFYKRAMEFAHMAILVDSTSYEGYYSKAQILKDLGELDDSLKAIEQTSRLVEKSIEGLNKELEALLQQEEAMIFDGCFDLLDKRKPSWFGKARLDLSSNLDYLEEAKKFISRLKAEIMNDKLRIQGNGNLDGQKAIFPTSTPIAT